MYKKKTLKYYLFYTLSLYCLRNLHLFMVYLCVFMNAIRKICIVQRNNFEKKKQNIYKKVFFLSAKKKNSTK